MFFPKVLKLKSYSKLYFAGLFSEMGAFITETALMLLVFQLSGQNSAWLGITRATFLIGLTAGTLSGGPLGQLINRRHLLMGSYLIRLPAIGALFLLDHVIAIVLMNAIIAFATGVYNPSRQAMINELVPQKHIREANGLFGSTMAILHLIGPFVGASLFVKFAGISEILWFNLLTYSLGIFLIYKIAYSPPPENIDDSQALTPVNDFFRQLRDGLHIMWKRDDFKAIVINSSVAGLSIGILVPLLLPYTTKVLDQPETAYGILLSCFGLGGIIGGYLSKKLSDRYKTGQIITISICCEPLMMVLFLLSPHFSIALFTFFIWGIAVFTRIPSQLNHLSESVDTKLLTRAHSLLDMSFVLPNILGGIIIGTLGNIYSPKIILSFTAIFFVSAIYLRLKTKSVQALFKSDVEKVERESFNMDRL